MGKKYEQRRSDQIKKKIEFGKKSSSSRLSADTSDLRRAPPLE